MLPQANRRQGAKPIGFSSVRAGLPYPAVSFLPPGTQIDDAQVGAFRLIPCGVLDPGDVRMKIKAAGGTKTTVKGAATKLNKRDAALRAAGTSSSLHPVPEPLKFGEGTRGARVPARSKTIDVR